MPAYPVVNNCRDLERYQVLSSRNLWAFARRVASRGVTAMGLESFTSPLRLAKVKKPA